MSDIVSLIRRLLSGPAEPLKEFVSPGCTYGDCYSHGAGFVDRFSAIEHDGEPVCLCTEDRGIIASAMLSSLAGGPVCVLPYSLSPQVLSEMRDILGFRYAIVDAPMELPDGVAGILPERGQWPPAKRPRDADSVFMQLFTGGSTGKPKVWQKTARNLLAEAAYQAEKYAFVGSDLVAATVPPYHIYGLLYTVMAPFLASASVLPGTYVFPGEIASVLAEKPATILVSVPVHYRLLKGADMDAPKLRLAFSSAGPLDREDAAAFYRRTGVGPEEIYGSTETGGIACKSSATGRNDLEPFECLEWKISHDRLCVKSPFISPDLPVDGKGFFMTGDRAMAAGGGRITLLGRADGVVKVGGKRVDLNEVQDKIKRLPGVRDACVISMSGSRGRGTDIAAVIETDMSEEEARACMAGALERYAVPRRIRTVATMPATSTGKYDREAIMKYFEFEQK
ncbi:MAG: acyl--CoA ligase [Spirochaetes bacterium]|nr:acyl--CoA ligase [Spirochaetota bacterium]